MKFRTVRRWVAAPVLIALGSAVFFYFWWNTFALQPFQGWSGPSLVVEIPKGEGAARIYARLQDSGLVRSDFAARLVHRWKLGGKPLRAGEYEFRGAATPEEILRKIADGRAKEYLVTLREGLDRWQVIEELDRALPWADPDLLEEAVSDPSLVRDLDPGARDLEGYLFPDTYGFTRGTPEREVIGRMVKTFHARFQDVLSKGGPIPKGGSVHQVVILASLVEAETGAPKERPKIAAVFFNRLRKSMLLQCDPTVIYALKLTRSWNGDIHKRDLALTSPYNTYVSPGLPPGPIGNPGRASLEAVLSPVDSQDLYFVSKNDGTHVFSADYETHRRAVDQWQKVYWRDKKAEARKQSDAEKAGTKSPG